MIYDIFLHPPQHLKIFVMKENTLISVVMQDTTFLPVECERTLSLALCLSKYIIVFVQGGSPTPHPFSSRPHFVCKFSRQRSTEVF